ncbi:MAG: HRDC domain-containing protein [Xanthomonadaceae bacterium]|nr:HRDC domain-containing protein [Xanthomonadaceae bacterium]
MLLKIFSLKFDALMGEFDDSSIQAFSRDKEVLQITDHLLIRNEIPYLILIIKYYPFRKEAQKSITPPQGGDEKKRVKEEWKKDLNDSDMVLFNQLRDWRAERCKKDGVPPYLIFTNMQLAAITKSRPQSPADLGRVDGVGTGKIERYAEDVLKITVIREAIKSNG